MEGPSFYGRSLFIEPPKETHLGMGITLFYIDTFQVNHL